MTTLKKFMLMSTASAFVALFTVGCEKDKKDSAPSEQPKTGDEAKGAEPKADTPKPGLTTVDPGLEAKDKADEPAGDHPANTDGKSDHPTGGDHPANTDGKSDHPKGSDHPTAE